MANKLYPTDTIDQAHFIIAACKNIAEGDTPSKGSYRSTK
jgi:hypothetical protein